MNNSIKEINNELTSTGNKSQADRKISDIKDKNLEMTKRKKIET